MAGTTLDPSFPGLTAIGEPGEAGEGIRVVGKTLVLTNSCQRGGVSRTVGRVPSYKPGVTQVVSMTICQQITQLEIMGRNLRSLRDAHRDTVECGHVLTPELGVVIGQVIALAGMAAMGVEALADVLRPVAAAQAAAPAAGDTLTATN